MNNNKLQAKDLINVGLFTVLYFVIGCCVAIPVGFVPVFLPVLGALWALITGIPFMLYLTRVKKFRNDYNYGYTERTSDGAYRYGLLGRSYGRSFRCSRRSDCKIGRLQKRKKAWLGYGVFILWMIGTYIPMYFMVKKSYADFAEGFEEEYAQRVMSVMPMWSLFLVIAGIFVFALLGGLIGKAVLKKHFVKAGIA